MVNEIKNLRIKIDGLAKLTKELKPLSSFIDGEYNSKEVEKAVDSLYLAKAWLGKCLSVLEVPTPYKNDGNRKTVEDIEPTADTYDYQNNWTWENIGHREGRELNHIEKVDRLRQEIQSIMDSTTDFSQEEPLLELEQGFVYKYLCEARFWLGWELSRIREVEK